MVNHLNEGCPIGSECTNTYGQKRAQFNQSLEKLSTRKKYFKKYGAPFKYLIKSNEINNKDSLAIWDSRCFHHRKSKTPYLEVEIFTKTSTKKPLPIITKKILYKSHNNQNIHVFELPINADIAGFKKSSLYFDIRENLSSFIYKIDKKGRFFVEKNPLNQKFRRTKCPKDLLENYAKHSFPAFRSYFCSLTPGGGTILTPVTCI